MLKLLIADDEPMELSMIQRAVNWNELGIELVGTACDGEEADALEEQLRPDIIITDVVMPVKNGMRLAETVKERHPEVHFIFVSGHRSFEYAQFGIKHDVDAYILKPITPSRLQETVEKVARTCTEEKRRQFEQEQFFSVLSDNMPKLRQLFFEELITDVPSEEYAERQLSFYDIHLSSQRLCVVLFRLTSSDAVESDVKQRKLLQFQILDAIGEMISSVPGVCCWARSDSEYVIICNCAEKDAVPQLSTLAQNILNNIQSACAVPMIAGIGEPTDGFTMLPVCYKTACAAADHSLFTGSGRIILYSDVARRGSETIPVPTALRDEIARAVSTGNATQLRRYFDELRQLLSGDSVSKSYVRNICVSIMSNAISGAMQVSDPSERGEGGNPPGNISGNPSGNLPGNLPYDRLFTLHTLDEILSYTESFLLELCARTAEGVHGRHNAIAAKIKEIVSERIDKDISMELLADALFLSRGYISHVFKDVTGESISRYVTREKMSRAKLLLRDPTLKITAIAESCGYDNPTYFSSVFRNEVGVSPKEYRARLLVPERNASGEEYSVAGSDEEKDDEK